MAESTLATPRDEILQAVGAFFDYGRNQWQWTREQAAQVNRIVRSAEQEFYSPPGHSWNFLRLRLSLPITSGDGDYDLPDGFAGFLDPFLSFAAADNRLWPVRETSVSRVLDLRQNASLIGSLSEFCFAKEAKTPTGTTGQRFQILLFPEPVAAGTLTGSYYANPDAMTDALPHAMGGAIHAGTLLACCLAAAELERDKKAGPLAERYQVRLAASISHDRRTGPKTFGYNGDRSNFLDDSRNARDGTITYNGDDTYFS